MAIPLFVHQFVQANKHQSFALLVLCEGNSLATGGPLTKGQ